MSALGADGTTGSRAPGVTCKRIADSRPVVVVSPTDFEVPRWRLPAGRGGNATAAVGAAPTPTPSVRGEESTRRQGVPPPRPLPPQGAPVPAPAATTNVGTAKLADVTHSMNLEIKIDDQELLKFMNEQGLSGGAGLRPANENQPCDHPYANFAQAIAAGLGRNRTADCGSTQDILGPVVVSPRVEPLVEPPPLIASDTEEPELPAPSRSAAGGTPTPPPPPLAPNIVVEEPSLHSEQVSLPSGVDAAQGSPPAVVVQDDSVKDSLAQPKSRSVPKVSPATPLLAARGGTSLPGRSLSSRPGQRPATSAGSMVRGGGAANIRPQPQAQNGRPQSGGNKRSGPVVAEHSLRDDAVRHTHDLRGDALKQGIHQLTEQVFSAMHVSRCRKGEASPLSAKSGKQSGRGKESPGASRGTSAQGKENLEETVSTIRGPLTEALHESVAKLASASVNPLPLAQPERAKQAEPQPTQSGAPLQEAGEAVHEHLRALTDPAVSASTLSEDQETQPNSIAANRGCIGREPAGEALRIGMNQLTQQLRSVLHSGTLLGSTGAPKSSKPSVPPPLTSSLAQAVHNEVERLVTGGAAQPIAQDVPASPAKDSELLTTAATAACETSSVARETVALLERLSVDEAADTSSIAASQSEAVSRTSGPVPKRAGRLFNRNTGVSSSSEGWTDSKTPGWQQSAQQRRTRSNTAEGRKRTGSSGSSRSESKGSTAVPGAPQATEKEGADSVFTPSAPVAVPVPLSSLSTEEVLREILAPTDAAAGNSSDDSKKKGRSGGWYSSERARELISEKEREAAEKRRAKEERERKRQEQLRRLESTYKARVNAVPPAKVPMQKPPAVVVSTAKPQAAATAPVTKSAEAIKAPELGKTAEPGKGHGRGVATGRGSSASARLYAKQPASGRGSSAGARLRPRPSSVGALRRPEDKLSRRSNSPPASDDTSRAKTDAGNYPRRAPSLVDNLRGETIASLSDGAEGVGIHSLGGGLSDGAEVPDGGRRFQDQPPRLQARIRAATLARARRKRQVMSQQSGGSIVEWPFHPMVGMPAEAWAEASQESQGEGGTSSDVRGDLPYHQGTALGDPIDVDGQFWQRVRGPRTRPEHLADDLSWDGAPYGDTALDPTRWPPSLHSPRVAGLSEAPQRHQARRDVPADAANQPSAGWTFDDLAGETMEAPPNTYLTPAHRRYIEEVIAEQRFLRRETPDSQQGVSVPARLGDPVARPPSRGGESSQPLGYTTPPAYEHITPEHYEQNQQHHHSLRPPSFMGESSSSSHAGITDEESVTPNEEYTGGFIDHPYSGHEIAVIDPAPRRDLHTEFRADVPTRTSPEIRVADEALEAEAIDSSVEDLAFPHAADEAAHLSQASTGKEPAATEPAVDAQQAAATSFTSGSGAASPENFSTPGAPFANTGAVVSPTAATLSVPTAAVEPRSPGASRPAADPGDAVFSHPVLSPDTVSSPSAVSPPMMTPPTKANPLLTSVSIDEEVSQSVSPQASPANVVVSPVVRSPVAAVETQDAIGAPAQQEEAQLSNVIVGVQTHVPVMTTGPPTPVEADQSLRKFGGSVLRTPIEAASERSSAIGSASERSEREEPLGRFGFGRSPSERSASAGEEATLLTFGRPASGNSKRTVSGERPVRSFQEAQRPLRGLGRSSASGRSASGSSASGDRPGERQLRGLGDHSKRERPLRSFGRVASDRSASGENTPEPVLSEDGQVFARSKQAEAREIQEREYRIEALRSEIASKRRTVEQMKLEKKRKRQQREEQRLLRELRRVEEEAEKLRQKEDSDEERAETSSLRSEQSATASVGAMAAREGAGTLDIEPRKGITTPPSGAWLGSLAVGPDAGRKHAAPPSVVMPASMVEEVRKINLSKPPVEDNRISGLQVHTVHGIADEIDVSELPQVPQPQGDASQYASSCGASTNSSSGDQALVIEEDVEVVEGELGLKVDEWRTVDAHSDMELAANLLRKEAEDRAGATATGHGFDEAAAARSGAGRAADDDDLPDSGEAAEVRMVNMAEPEAKSHVADEMVDELMDKLLEEELLEDISTALAPLPPHTTPATTNSSGSATPLESELRHPTPVVPASVIAGWSLMEGQDAKSENSDSAESERRTPPAPRRTPPENLGEEQPSDAKSGSSSGSDDGHLGKDSGLRTGSTKESRMPFGALNAGDIDASQIRTPKDAGPPRPPSPPPDMRPSGTAGTTGGDATGSRSRDETTDIISQELLHMMLDEAIDIWQGESPKEKKSGRKVPLEKNEAKQIASSSPPRGRRKDPPPFVITDGRESDTDSALESSAQLGSAQDLAWMESMVGPFKEAVLQQLGVTDEDTPVQTPLPQLNTWLPMVIEVMRRKEGASSSPSSPSSTDTSGKRHKERDVNSWTRLLADIFVELASEEVKAEPKVLGWRRPGYFRLPQDLRVSEGRDTQPQQTWKKVMSRLEEVTRSCSKLDGFGDTTTIAGALENELHGPGNIDEGIDQLLEDQVIADEASWLDIGSDVVQVKNQVVALIFSELIEETAVEIQTLWTH